MVTITSPRDRSKPYFEGDIPAETAWEIPLDKTPEPKRIYENAMIRFLFAAIHDHPDVEKFKRQYQEASDRYTSMRLKLHTQN